MHKTSSSDENSSLLAMFRAGSFKRQELKQACDYMTMAYTAQQDDDIRIM